MEARVGQKRPLLCTDRGSLRHQLSAWPACGWASCAGGSNPG
jgi:hypothetical protein